MSLWLIFFCLFPVVEDLFRSREPVPEMKAIYFMSPTAKVCWTWQSAKWNISFIIWTGRCNLLCSVWRPLLRTLRLNQNTKERMFISLTVSSNTVATASENGRDLERLQTFFCLSSDCPDDLFNNMKLYCAKYIRVCKEMNMCFMPQEAQVSCWMSFLCDPVPLFCYFMTSGILLLERWETKWLMVMSAGCLCLSSCVFIRIIVGVFFPFFLCVFGLFY